MDHSNGNGHQPVTAIQLVITFDQATGQINVNGPLDNAVLCFGMMEAAKDSIRKYVENQTAGRRIVPAAGLIRM